jgi:glycosyltransferase involved in cell wall biosynthesis
MAAELWLVMPVYNEGTALEVAVREWVATAREACPDLAVCVVDDGSTDDTPAVLARLAAEIPTLHALRQANAGHGQACLHAYRTALAAGARWVLQVDSDGQCDPRHFAALWRARGHARAVFGRRRHRGDGLVRTAISRVLALVIAAATGIWVRDANSPYRLMRADALATAVAQIPANVSLANVLVAVGLQRDGNIAWVDVGFRPRLRPTSLRPRYFIAEAVRLWGDLRRWQSGTRRGRNRATRTA